MAIISIKALTDGSNSHFLSYGAMPRLPDGSLEVLGLSQAIYLGGLDRFAGDKHN